MSIPKIIHYCWFGKNEKPELVKKCIASWYSKLKDFEFMEWNEDNFDVFQIQYTAQAYEHKKYAFVSDYARLKVLKQFGGIYLDTDVEVLKNLDVFLKNDFFAGFENHKGVAPGLIMGSIPNHPLLDELMQFYENHPFINVNGSCCTYTTVQNCTNILLKHGLILDENRRQNLNGIMIYEKEVFCPDANTRKTGNYSNLTYTVHHYMASWRDEKYNKRLNNPIWKAFVQIGSYGKKKKKKKLGVKRSNELKTGKLSKLYDAMRGIKDD